LTGAVDEGFGTLETYLGDGIDETKLR
jgi:hypothetical protein